LFKLARLALTGVGLPSDNFHLLNVVG
jgi:hypothetical protein